MATFTLHWDNTAVLANSNVTAQRASYRRRSVGGTFATTGFTPANDMAKSVVSAVTGTLLDNVVYQFKVEAICTSGGPSINSNGLVENIKFDCIIAEVAPQSNSVLVKYTSLPVDIISVDFTIWDNAGTSIIQGPFNVPVVAGATQRMFTGLASATNYQSGIKLRAVLNNATITQVISPECKTAFTTADAGDCDAPTNVTGLCTNCTE